MKKVILVLVFVSSSLVNANNTTVVKDCHEYVCQMLSGLGDLSTEDGEWIYNNAYNMCAKK